MAHDIAALVAGLTLDEKALLTSGDGFWSTHGIARAAIPPVWVTDGPNGARGPVLPGVDAGATTAACFPCGSALGATFDTALVERVGAAIGEEARTKGCRVLLAPTVNLHRSPLAGRNFECYSEDPLLAGRIAAAFVRGAQSRGVATTVKHFVGNECERDRMVSNSIIDERTRRELYLVPFELAIREGGALGVMTSYNLVNGSYVADDASLLRGVLRDEWGFEGFVVTDWFAQADTVRAAHAGLDLEMPGPARAFGATLAAAVRDGRVPESVLDAAVHRLLDVFARIGALDDPVDRTPESVDRPEHRALAYDAAVGASVLLRNDGVLPFDTSALRRVAVIGPNAGRARIMGGGSAQFAPHHLETPLDALRAALEPGIEVVHEPGVDIARSSPAVPGDWLQRADGSPGLDVEIVGHLDQTEPGAPDGRADTALWFFGRPAGAPDDAFAARATAILTPTASGRFTLSLVQAGRARVLLDGVLVLDGVRNPPPTGTELFGAASRELSVPIELVAGRPHQLRIEFDNPGGRLLSGCKVGLRPAPDPHMFERAVAAAASADAVVIVVGTDDEWEREGHDRDDLRLPGAQDDLVAAALAVNPNTVVVMNCGAPMAMPWADHANAILHCWFGGQEMARAIADVLLGHAEPAGRLPCTFPKRIEDTPSFGSFPTEDGAVRYGEGLLVGYRWYGTRHIEPHFAFGHGLGYTTFVFGVPRPSTTTFHPGDALTVDVDVTNTGERDGHAVVQCYVAPLDATVFRPEAELKAFVKVAVPAGRTVTVPLALDARSFAHWRPGDPSTAARIARVAGAVPFMPPVDAVAGTSGWQVDPGRYELRIGTSSNAIVHRVAIDVIERARAQG